MSPFFRISRDDAYSRDISSMLSDDLHRFEIPPLPHPHANCLVSRSRHHVVYFAVLNSESHYSSHISSVASYFCGEPVSTLLHGGRHVKHMCSKILAQRTKLCWKKNCPRTSFGYDNNCHDRTSPDTFIRNFVRDIIVAALD